MQVFICDDEQQMVSEISRKVKSLLPDSQVNSFTKATDLLNTWEEIKCDLLLLDIDMPEMNGLEIAKRLNTMDNKPLLIFVTGHDELVYESFQCHPFGFCRKSFLEQELPGILQDCVKELEKREQAFFFRAGNMQIKLLISEILYLEAEANYIKLFTESQEYRFRDTISKVQESLGARGFIRIHRGFLINQSAVRILQGDEVELNNGVRLPIGRNYSEEARKLIMRYMMK